MKKDIGNGYMFIIRKWCVNAEVQKLIMVSLKGSSLLISPVKLENESIPNPDATILHIHILYHSGIKTVLFNHPV